MLAIILFAVACGINQEHYETAAQARRFGLAQRGMLPECVPDTARNVHAVIDHESGRVWVWCDLDRQGQAELHAKVQRVGWGQAAANTTRPPYTWASPAWNPILGGTLMYTPPGTSLYFVFGNWHGIADPDGKCWITLTAGTKHA